MNLTISLCHGFISIEVCRVAFQWGWRWCKTMWSVLGTEIYGYCDKHHSFIYWLAPFTILQLFVWSSWVLSSKKGQFFWCQKQSHLRKHEKILEMRDSRTWKESQFSWVCWRWSNAMLKTNVQWYHAAHLTESDNCHLHDECGSDCQKTSHCGIQATAFISFRKGNKFHLGTCSFWVCFTVSRLQVDQTISWILKATFKSETLQSTTTLISVTVSFIDVLHHAFDRLYKGDELNQIWIVFISVLHKHKGTVTESHAMSHMSVR